MGNRASHRMTTREAEEVLRERKIEVGATAEEVAAEIGRRGFKPDPVNSSDKVWIVQVHPPKEYKGWPVFFAHSGSTMVLTPEAFVAPERSGTFDSDQAMRDALVRAFAEAVLNVKEEAAAWESESGAESRS